MPTQVTINSITGTEPFSVFICDDPITMCVWIDQINNIDLPYTFNVPIILAGSLSYNVKIVDGNGCVFYVQSVTYKQFEDFESFEFMDDSPYDFQ